MTGQELLKWLRECTPEQLSFPVILNIDLHAASLITAKVYNGKPGVIYLIYK